MSLINVAGLTFSYDGSFDLIFEDVDFQIDTDWKLGLIGRNGRGKTTFLNLLRGRYEYKGVIKSSVCFDYFPYDVDDKDKYTIDVLREIAPECMDWELYREFALLKIDEEVMYRSFSSLSGGEQTKALLAALFLKQNNFMLIDEPTNHLDSEARKIVGEYLCKKKGFIVVSHDRTLLDMCVDHIISVNKADIQIQKGNFSSWYENKCRQDQMELNENHRLEKDIQRLSSSAKKTAVWSDKIEKSKYGTKNAGLKADRGYVGHRSAKMMKRSKSAEMRRQKAAEEKSKLLHNIERTEVLSVSTLINSSSRLIELNNVSLLYGEKTVCGDVNLSLRQGERLSVRGRNGSGKSSLLRLINGGGITYTGDVYKARGLKISYVPQDTSHLKGSLSEYAENLGINESIFKSVLIKMGMERAQFYKDISQFSQGQKKKVSIAGSLCEKAHIYIWDEPLNFIDIISRMQIENVLIRCRPTMVFVEHDISFCENVATKVIELKRI